MNRSARKLSLLDTAGSILRCGLARTIAQLPCSMVLILFLASAGLPLQANAAQAGTNNSRRSAVGWLKVWTPAGIVGGEYWIYLNGHIVDTPPHGTADPKSHEIVTIATGERGQPNDGWVIWASGGEMLRMHHESYDNAFHLPDDCLMEPGVPCYLSPGSGDTLHLFQEFELSLPPDKYTVEVAIYSRGRKNSFPFVFTRKYVVYVRRGHKTQLDVGVPDDWSDDVVARAPSSACGEDAVGPDLNQLQLSAKEYRDDPMVSLLHRVDASSLPGHKGVVILDLLPVQGGSREFDGRQIRHLADSISGHHPFPSHSNVAECQSRFPQFSQSYAQYDKMISFIEGDIESFRKMAANLEGNR